MSFYDRTVLKTIGTYVFIVLGNLGTGSIVKFPWFDISDILKIET